MRAHERDLAKWRDAGGLDWTADDLAPHYDRVEARLGVRERRDWPTSVRTVDQGFRALGAGLEPVRSYTDANCMRCGSCLQGCPTNAGKSTLNTYIHDTWATGQLELRPNSRVERIVIEDGEAKGVEYTGPDGSLHRVDAGVDPVERAVGAGVLDALRLPVLDDDPLDPGVRAQLELPGRPGVVDVRVERRLAGVGRAALQARPAAHAVGVGVGAHGLQPGAERSEPLVDRADARRPVAPLAHAEARFDPVVVRGEVVGGPIEAARVPPFREVALVGPHGDLRVDRGAAADAAAGDEPDRAACAAVDEAEADRPPHVVRRLRLPAREVRSGEVRPELEEQHAAP